MTCLKRLFVILSVLAWTQGFAAPDALTREWKFRVYLDEREIGYHHFYLQESDGSRQLLSEANFEYRLLFIKLYGYEHRTVEDWQGDCLTRVESSTDANGRPYAVVGQREGDRFRVTQMDGESSLPKCVMSFAYWNPAFLDEARLLNPQDGEYLSVSVTSLPQEPVEVGGMPVAARKYRLQAEGLDLLLWYSAEGSDWLALEAQAPGGRRLRYQRS